jgi:hypothetical protein
VFELAVDSSLMDGREGDWGAAISFVNLSFQPFVELFGYHANRKDFLFSNLKVLFAP